VSAFLPALGWIALALACVLALALAFALGVRAGLTGARKLLRKGYYALREDVAAIEIHPRTAGALSFLALGDVGTGDADQRAVAATARALVAQRRCDFIVLLGDNFYEDGVTTVQDPKFQSHFESLYGDLGIPVLPVLGNHDVKRDALAQVLYTLRSQAWRMPNVRYGFQAGPARFFALNTNLNLLEWWDLRRRLLPSRLPWTIVIGHHSLYGSGTQGDADPVGRWYWGRYLAPQVDVYLAAHNHQLEHLQVPGLPTDYVISGAGGSHYREQTARGERFKPTAAHSRFVHRDTGLVWFGVTEGELTCEFLDGAGRALYRFSKRK
jgi:hypothetical protein